MAEEVYFLENPVTWAHFLGPNNVPPAFWPGSLHPESASDLKVLVAVSDASLDSKAVGF